MTYFNRKSDWSSAAQLYDGYVAPMDGALLGLAEVAPGISDSFAASTSAANSVLIVTRRGRTPGAEPGRMVDASTD